MKTPDRYGQDLNKQRSALVLADAASALKLDSRPWMPTVLRTSQRSTTRRLVPAIATCSQGLEFDNRLAFQLKI